MNSVPDLSLVPAAIGWGIVAFSYLVLFVGAGAGLFNMFRAALRLREPSFDVPYLAPAGPATYDLTYSLPCEGGPRRPVAMTCRICGLTTNEPSEVRKRHCPYCNVFHEAR